MHLHEHNLSQLAGARCAVLGANGFIGTNLCIALRDAGATVVGVGRSPRARDILMDRVEWRRADLATGNAFEHAVRDCDFVVHLANTLLPTPSNAEKVRDVQENLIGTLTLLERCRELGVGKVVYASSGGTVYGPQTNTPISEDVLPRPICSYGVVKHAVEGYLHLYRQLHRLDYVALRIANPFGPHQMPHDQGLVAALFGKALTGTPISIWGDGSVVRDYVYIQDVVEAIIAAMVLNEPDAPRIYNIGSGVGRSVNDVIASIQAIHGELPEVGYQHARAADVPVNVLDIRRAQTYLGWTPATPWHDALQATYKWLRDALGVSSKTQSYAIV